MDYISSEEMDVLDRNCEYLGLSRELLMENAGYAIAQEIISRFKKGTVSIFAGLGNNGGDAFASARHLKNFDVEIILLGKEADIRTKEARKNFELLKKADFRIIEVSSPAELEEIKMRSDIVVDAIFGTGVKHPIKEPFTSAIDLINGSHSWVLSVDLPSGMDPDRGDGDKIVKADLVVSLHKKKVGFKNYRGEVKVADIGIPSFFEKISGPGDLRILSRAPSTHKGDNGRILIVGGGEYFGAPVLTAFAALRTGADIATLAVPERIAKIVSSFSPNLIVRKLSGDFLRMEHVPLIKKLLKKHDVLTIGMGLGEEGETKAAIPEILQERKKTVVDADALIKTKFQKGTILTPHAGEFMELYGKLPEGLSERMERVREISKKEGVVVLLKGVEDIISDGERVKINRTGNAGMTVGGSGDVLSGIVSALYALTSDPLRAASGGAFLSGVAGDLAYEEKRIGLLPTDIIEKIPYAIKKYC